MILYTIEIEELFNRRYRIGDGRRKCVVEIQETMGEKKKKDHRTQFWCPHPHCQVHVCRDHRQAVHGFYDQNIILKGNSRESRVEFTRDNPGAKKATRTSGARKKQKKIHNCSKIVVKNRLQK